MRLFIILAALGPLSLSSIASDQRLCLKRIKKGPPKRPVHRIIVEDSIDEANISLVRRSLENVLRYSFGKNVKKEDISIRCKIEPAVYLSAQPELGRAITNPNNKKYRIYVSPEFFRRFPGQAALDSILAHEIHHLFDYSDMNRRQLIELGIRYASSPKFVRNYERGTDIKTIESGYGEGLIDYRFWLYEKIWQEYKHSPKKAAYQIEKKKRNYLSPEEIESYLEK